MQAFTLGCTRGVIAMADAEFCLAVRFMNQLESDGARCDHALFDAYAP